MNNPNFRSLGEAGGDSLDESNDGAQKQDEKARKRKFGLGIGGALAKQPDARLFEPVQLFHREGSAKKEAADEAVIYSSKEEKQKPTESENEQADEIAEDDTAAAEYVEELDAAERQEVVEAYIETRTEAVQAENETVAAGDAEQSAIAANKAFLNTVRRELRNPAPAGEQDMHVEQAVATAFEDVEQQIATGVDLQETVEDDATKQPAPSEVAAPGSLQYEDVESSDTQSLAAYAAAQAPHVHAAAGGMPPQYMHAAAGNMAPQPGFAQAVGGNMAPAAPAERHMDVADWFVPAAVAYLWGRHNGRKKAERRLLPQQKKLEITVRELVSEVAAKEARIRQMARQQAELRAAKQVAEQVAAAPNGAPQQIVERAQPVAAPYIAPRYRVAEGPAPIPVPVAERVQSAVPERPSVPPAEMAPSAQPRAEAPARIKTPPEVMNHQELLAAGAEIFIGSVDLKSIYEDNKVSEEGLRRLVIEHAHGGDIRSILKDEMLKHEMKYELDPMQQDAQASPEAAPVQQPQAPVLPPWLMDSLPTAPPQVLTTTEPIQPPEPLPSSRSKRTSGIISTQTRRTVQPVLVAANAVAFTLLVILLAVLLFVWLR